MILSNSKPLSTPFNFLKENYGDHKLSFFQLQNNRLYFTYEDDIIFIKAEVKTDSTIYISNQITFNTPNINWQFIDIYTKVDSNIIESWVAKDYKWS
jgi:hypothetical protein